MAELSLILFIDARIRVGVPIIGCPDYIGLMTHRALQQGIPLEPPYFPASLRQLVGKYDPVHCDAEGSNPFIGKKVLVLCGETDDLVPWSASAEFVGNLNVGATGTKRVEVHEGVGHQCTGAMEDEALQFVKENMLT